ncbi:MAG: thiosulfate oxidation carrier complex protein SoxZ [Burkholderiaceae bacterium]|nr:thiosulfate oxidation carrier complex protein SoxZ [Burkholderiaceae bacterium]
MGQPSRIRATVQGNGAVVRVLMTHAMESGQRRDASGTAIPAWHIAELTATLNGQPVMTAQWGPGVSANPFLQFRLTNAKPGDTVGIAWKDNRGDTRSDQAVVG